MPKLQQENKRIKFVKFWMKTEIGLKKMRRSRADFVIILQTSSLQQGLQDIKGKQLWKVY